MSCSTSVFYCRFQSVNKGRKIIKKHRFEKNEKVSLFIDDIVYVEKPRAATKRDTRNGKFSKISGYKVNI